MMAGAVSVKMLLAFPTTLQHYSITQINGKSSSLKLVSETWGRSATAFPPSFKASRLRISCSAKAETVEKVCEIVRKQLALPPESELTPESKFSTLGADSLDTVEIVMGLEEEFDIVVEEDSSQNISTVQEAADLIEKLLENKPKP